MHHLGTVNLETRRLLLRRFCMEDAEQMYKNWAANDHVTKYLTWPSHGSVEETKSVLESWISEYKSKRTYNWCMELKETGEAIGSFGIVDTDEETKALEIGYCISEKYWHLGLTLEAFLRVNEFLFEDVCCNRIWSEHDVNNPNSGRVMEKAGLKEEGILRQAGRNNTGICDMKVYGLIREEYEEKKRNASSR